MNARSLLSCALLAGALPTLASAAKPGSDIVPPDLRHATVEQAQRLARPPTPIALPAEIKSPFSPAGFERSDASEAHENRPEATDKTGSAPAAPQTDRDVLAAVAAKIPTTGTIILGGKALLISGTNRIEAGSHFTVIYNGQEYELELVAIDRTTFTVRYKGEEFTRPIKQGKSP